MLYRVPASGMAMVVRLLGSDDAKLLSKIARETYHDTFEATDPPDDHALYLRQTYSEEKQKHELESPDYTALLLLVGGEEAGFTQLRRADPPEHLGIMNSCEIWRFYMRKKYRGLRLGDMLMSAAVWHVMYLYGSSLCWLTCWQGHHAAQSFYLRHGFQVVGQKEFVVGNDRQTNLVLVRDLTYSGVNR